MAISVPTISGSPDAVARLQSDRAGRLAAEWPVYAVLFSAAAIVIGLVWDISWHRTIGRDTFWSPPHLLEQAGAIVSGLSCGYLVLWTTFAGSPEARARSVRFWKYFYGPVGAWVCIWGALMMIASAPFDNWWHGAYGLDVQIISPPHIVLASGMVAIMIGAMLMALAAQNRATGSADMRRLGAIFTCSAALIVLMATTMVMENAGYANEMHSSQFYRIISFMLPIFLVAFARASRVSWPATRIALVYMAIALASIWILQLVPATPMLAPIYNPVTHMVPPPFPLLLVFPALVIDVLLKRYGEDHDWRLSVMLGMAFVITMLVTHWFWAEFMISPAARNFVFGAGKWDYSTRIGPWGDRFWNVDSSRRLFAQGIAIAIGWAMLMSRLGLAWGKGMSRIRR
jgi:hypothetical protein